MHVRVCVLFLDIEYPKENFSLDCASTFHFVAAMLIGWAHNFTLWVQF